MEKRWERHQSWRKKIVTRKSVIPEMKLAKGKNSHYLLIKLNARYKKGVDNE
jgi:hypothetical protein